MRTRKRSKMTERDFRFSICYSAIGQLHFQICALRRHCRLVFSKSSYYRSIHWALWALNAKHFIAFYQLVVSPWGSKTNNRKYSFGCPERLLKFWALIMGAYSRRALVRGWTLIKRSLFSASSKLNLKKKTVNNNKTWRCARAEL